jgi:hypothetical protein
MITLKKLQTFINFFSIFLMKLRNIYAIEHFIQYGGKIVMKCKTNIFS